MGHSGKMRISKRHACPLNAPGVFAFFIQRGYVGESGLRCIIVSGRAFMCYFQEEHVMDGVPLLSRKLRRMHALLSAGGPSLCLCHFLPKFLHGTRLFCRLLKSVVDVFG